jgi:DUF4097 and DUF4098 domain-containing protein YvlB
MNTDNLKKEIKNVRVWHIAVLCAGVFLAFAIIGTILISVGGGWSGSQWNIAGLGAGKQYDINDSKELDMAGADSIVISSVSDNVTVLGGGEKVAATLKGTCNSTGGPVTLEATRSGNTINIQVKYPRSIGFNSNNTALTVTIPEQYAGDMKVSTVSGGISGESLPFKLQDVTLSTTSGGIHFSTAAYTTLKASTISGDVSLTGIQADTAVNTTSGQVSLSYGEFAPTTVSTVSGCVDAAIPQSASFRVDFSSVSGEFSSTHPGIAVDKADHSFSGSAAGGTALLKVNTVSGGFAISGK